MNSIDAATIGIAAMATAGIITRPWNLPEFVWAIAGAVALVALNVLPLQDAWQAVLKGSDVYFFLIGMMLLSEVARSEGLFDWLAVKAVQAARGSQRRLFFIIYLVGTLVTVFLSNDATAVVLTPAVYAAARAAKVEPLPYLFVCAFIANAASFVLPISNPANLVVMGEHMPPLAGWLALFAIPSVVSIVVTYVALRLTQRSQLLGPVADGTHTPPLGTGSKIAAAGIMLTAIVLMAASALGRDLGLPTFVAGAAVTLLVVALGRQSALSGLGAILKDVSWSVLPLVAGLFILVEGLSHAGILSSLATLLSDAASSSPRAASFGAGLGVGVVSNLINNLPMGLISANLAQIGHLSMQSVGAMLVGVDLGPNLSVTGSLATLLWLIALRREGENVAALQFLKLGLVVMPPALVLALAALLLS